MECGIAEDRDGFCIRRVQERREVFREAGDITVGHESGELLSGNAAHLSSNATKPLYSAANVVVPVSPSPDVVGDLLELPCHAGDRVRRDSGRVPEVLDESSVEAIEHDEVRLIRILLSKTSAPAEHLLEQDA